MKPYFTACQKNCDKIIKLFFGRTSLSNIIYWREIFICHPFHCYSDQFEGDLFFLRGCLSRTGGDSDSRIQGNVFRSATTTDRHRGNIPTSSQLRPFADYKENHDPVPGEVLLRKQTRVSVILSTANQRPYV